jgi:hypothetical protein
MDLIELIVSASLFILIWMIQILHYPSFLFVDRTIFADFENFHANRISWIVIPLMLTEAGIAIVNGRPIVLGIVCLIWLSTFLLQVPCHNKLRAGFHEETILRLISTNWIRTILWSIKFFILLYGALWPVG